MSWNLNLNEKENLNAEALLSQCLLRKHIEIEIKQDKNLILKSCGIDVV